MRLRFIVTLFNISLFGVFFTSCNSLILKKSKKKITAENIWTNYLSNLYKDSINLSKITTAIYSQEIKDSSGKVIIINNYKTVFPNKIRMESDCQGIYHETIIVNDSNGIKIAKGDTSAISYYYLCAMLECPLFFPGVKMENFGYKLNSFCDTVIENKQYYLIEWNNEARGINSYYYFNKKKSMLKWFEYRYIGGIEKIYIKKMKKIRGVKTAKKVKVFINSEWHSYKLKQLKFNIEIPDSLFDW